MFSNFNKKIIRRINFGSKSKKIPYSKIIDQAL